MIITFSPMRMDRLLTVTRDGDRLHLNGETLDLARYDMEEAPNPWIVGQPVREAGIWQVTLILPHGPAAPEATRFPAPLQVQADGPVPLPPYTTPAAEG